MSKHITSRYMTFSLSFQLCKLPPGSRKGEGTLCYNNKLVILCRGKILVSMRSNRFLILEKSYKQLIFFNVCRLDL